VVNNEKEVRELSEIPKKKFRFFIVRTDRDSILAFRVGEYSEVKDIMQKLENSTVLNGTGSF